VLFEDPNGIRLEANFVPVPACGSQAHRSTPTMATLVRSAERMEGVTGLTSGPALRPSPVRTLCSFKLFFIPVVMQVVTAAKMTGRCSVDASLLSPDPECLCANASIGRCAHEMVPLADAPVQALPAQRANLDLDHVEPTGVLGV